MDRRENSIEQVFPWDRRDPDWPQLLVIEWTYQFGYEDVPYVRLLDEGWVCRTKCMGQYDGDRNEIRLWDEYTLGHSLLESIFRVAHEFIHYLQSKELEQSVMLEHYDFIEEEADVRAMELLTKQIQI